MFRGCSLALKYMGIEYIIFVSLIVKNEDQRRILKIEHQITFRLGEI